MSGVGGRHRKPRVPLNTVGHAQMVKVLSGQGSSSVTIKNGQVTINLGPLIDKAKQRLAARGLTIVDKLPPINPTFAMFSAKYLVKAQTAHRVLNDLKIVLPIVPCCCSASAFPSRGATGAP